MLGVVTAFLTIFWHKLWALDPLWVSLIGIFVLGAVPVAAYYGGRAYQWWETYLNSFMKIDFDHVKNTVPGFDNVRRISLVVRNTHRSKTLSGAVLQLNYLQPAIPSEQIRALSSQFAEFQIQPEHSPQAGRNGIDLRPGQREAFICLTCRNQRGDIELPGYNSQTGVAESFCTPLVEYRMRFTATATNAVPDSRDFDLCESGDGTFSLKPIATRFRVKDE